MRAASRPGKRQERLGNAGNGVVSNNRGWYAGGGFDYMAHKGALVDVILGVEYQHFGVGAARAFCVNPGGVVPAVRDFDLSASGDIVRGAADRQDAGIWLWPSWRRGGLALPVAPAALARRFVGRPCSLRPGGPI